MTTSSLYGCWFFVGRRRRESACKRRNTAGLPGKSQGRRGTQHEGIRKEGVVIAKNEGPRINGEITARTCRLIGVDGSQLGLFGLRDALRVAHEQNLDLVEISPNADPPVCKVMDYGKFKYEQAIKAKAARKNQSKVEIKEMKFRPKIDTGDYETKKGHVMRFLKKGARVKITIMFRGREMAHPEQGLNVLERLAEDLKPYATVESQPKMEGRNMHMLVAPIKGAFDDAPADDTQDSKKEN
jgi:translation initiation factor IF-3